MSGLKGVLPLALGWHSYVVIRSPLDPSNWKIGPLYKGRKNPIGNKAEQLLYKNRI